MPQNTIIPVADCAKYKYIKLTLPAFLSPNVANVLVQNFGIAGITDVENDMRLFGIE